MKTLPYITERLLMGSKESNKKNVFPGSDNFGSNPLYFTFCNKTLPDMSSADNLCKRFGPRSGPTFCSGLIGVQTVCKGYQQMTMWSWTDVFYFCAKSLHADNPFKQFGTRSGLTFCLDLIGVQTVWHFRGYDKLKLNQCILTLH